jgi:hypothetical protein
MQLILSRLLIAVNLIVKVRRVHTFSTKLSTAASPGTVELDRQLVAIDRGDIAVAKFLVKHPVGEPEAELAPAVFRDQLAFDRRRQAVRAGTASLFALLRKTWMAGTSPAMTAMSHIQSTNYQPRLNLPSSSSCRIESPDRRRPSR